MESPHIAAHGCSRCDQPQQLRCVGFSSRLAVNPETFRGQRGKLSGSNHIVALMDRTYPSFAMHPARGSRDTVPQRDRRLPTKTSELCDVQKLSRCAIGFVCVPAKFTVKTNYVAD